MASSFVSLSGMPQTNREPAISFQTMNTEGPTKRVPEMEGTPEDQVDMHRMGKIQEFKVQLCVNGIGVQC